MIPLTVRSHYSLMWGTASVKRLCRHAAALGYDRLALTDTDNLYGLWPFLAACRRMGIRPIVGAEVTDPSSRHRAVCLVENEAGYAHLCRLLTRRHLDETFDLIGLVMPPWYRASDRDADEYLQAAAHAGARQRYGPQLPRPVVDRLAHELGIIARMKFSVYFLIVQEIIENSPRICGRGSGTASLVAYCLGITNVCPLKYNLYFERFLNPGRSDQPDIDIDFAWDERDDVQTAVLEKYR